MKPKVIFNKEIRVRSSSVVTRTQAHTPTIVRLKDFPTTGISTAAVTTTYSSIEQ